jgi:hypothetical protein
VKVSTTTSKHQMKRPNWPSKYVVDGPNRPLKFETVISLVDLRSRVPRRSVRGLRIAFRRCRVTVYLDARHWLPSFAIIGSTPCKVAHRELARPSVSKIQRPQNPSAVCRCRRHTYKILRRSADSADTYTKSFGVLPIPPNRIQTPPAFSGSTDPSHLLPLISPEVCCGLRKLVSPELQAQDAELGA